jgi:ubiquinone biosynthesis protein UbiJ
LTPSQLLTGAVEAALNRYLRLDPATLPRLEKLSGKVIAVEITGTSVTLYLLPGATGMVVHTQHEGSVDTLLCGTPWALLCMATQKGNGANTLLASEQATLSGDTELAQQVKHILDDMDIDWEELLSRVVGDVLAHNVMSTARDARTWGERSLAVLGQNFTEYQQEEARNLPTCHEVNAYLKAVDVLRDDVERTAQRVSRLQSTVAQDAEARV